MRTNIQMISIFVPRVIISKNLSSTSVLRYC